MIVLLGAGLVAGLLMLGARLVRNADAAALRRFGPVFGGLAGAGVLFAVIGGVESSGAIVGATAFIVLGPLLGFLASRGRKGRTLERSWSGSTSSPTAAEFAGRSGNPSPWSVARALGRVEARELSTSVWFGVGVGFCVLMYAVFGFVYSADNTETWDEYVQISPWFAHPLVGMCVLAGHRAVTRARRDGADELLETCPAEPTTRTYGFLLAAVVPVATLSVFLIGLLVTSAIRSPGIHGPVGGDLVVDVLAAIALGAGGVALGVALGRWVRFGLAPVVAVVLVALSTTALNGVGAGDWNPLTALATAPTVEGPSPVFVDRPAQWHLVWILGLVGLTIVVALSRHRRDRAVVIGGVGAAVLLLVAGVAATRPLSSGSAGRIADLVAHPDAHQECMAVDGHVRACVFETHRELLHLAVARIRPVARALPAALPMLTLRQSYDGELADLPPEVRRLLEPADLRRPGREVRLDFGQDDTYVISDAGFDLALASLGLPVEPDADLMPTVVAGEARGVVALWLATRGLDAGQAAEASNAVDPSSSDPFERGSLEIDPCAAPALTWSAQDLTAARSVIALPEAEVLQVVHAGWDRWIDPRTGTDELLAALGLAPVGPFDQVVARAGSHC